MYICKMIYDLIFTNMRYLFLLFVSAITYAQQSKAVDFKTIHAGLEINPIKRNIVGKCEYVLR